MSRWSRGPIIGWGSTATVSAAVIKTSGEVLAVKSANLSNSGHLQREQELLSSLSSPHIVGYRGFDVTRENSKLLYNLFMEFYPRGTLRNEIDVDRHVTAARDEVTIVSGLEYLYSRGLVRCDLKSWNILIGDDSAKISDLGVLEARDLAGVWRHTAVYGAGSGQRRGAGVLERRVGPGCTFIEMATGKVPWADSSAVLHRIAYSEESPAIPSYLTEQARDFLGKCLRKDQKQRWTPTQLLKHPFLAESKTTSDASKQPNSWSPTCVLDDHGRWSSLEETEPPNCVRTIPEILSDKILFHRIQRLSFGSGRPHWTLGEDWITSMENSDLMQY